MSPVFNNTQADNDYTESVRRLLQWFLFTLHGTRNTQQPETHVAPTTQNFWRSILLIILQKCNFSKDHHKLPKDGPDGPKHIGVNA
jgi:hypothetical protein